MTTSPHLFAARAEVNAAVDLRFSRHVHFILSAMPRGGFSGGLAVTEGGIPLGLITSSLLADEVRGNAVGRVLQVVAQEIIQESSNGR